MNCPTCSNNTKVTDSRTPEHEGTKRLRVCLSCGYKFTTVEVLASYSTEPKKRGRKKQAETLGVKPQTAHIPKLAVQVADDVLSGMTVHQIASNRGMTRQGIHYIINSFKRKDELFYRELKNVATRVKADKVAEVAKRNLAEAVARTDRDEKLFSAMYASSFNKTLAIVRKWAWNSNDDRLDSESLISSAWALAWEHWSEIQEDDAEKIIGHICTIAKYLAYPELRKNNATSLFEDRLTIPNNGKVSHSNRPKEAY